MGSILIFQKSKKSKSRNNLNIQLDSIGVGVANASATFLPVFLSRLNATSVEVGLLSALPSIAGLILAIPAGQLLQRQKNILPWYAITRAMFIAGYAFSSIVTFLIPRSYWVVAILIIWGVVAVPQTILSITFNVVMNQIAGSEGRFELMTRRWSLLSIVTALSVFLAGILLEKLSFPFNYQLVLILLSLGGILSYYASSVLILPTPGSIPKKRLEYRFGFKHAFAIVRKEKPFLTLILKRFVFLFGLSLALPLFPLYYVRVVRATDGWIATIATIQTAVLVAGYFFWTFESRKRGSRFVLLTTTFGLSLYPLVTAFTTLPWMIAIIAGFAGIFQAGVDLVLFDELMKTIPSSSSSLFVSVAQTLSYLAAIISPLIGTYLAGFIGYGNALIISAMFLFLGFVLFMIPLKKSQSTIS